MNNIAVKLAGGPLDSHVINVDMSDLTEPTLKGVTFEQCSYELTEKYCGGYRIAEYSGQVKHIIVG